MSSRRACRVDPISVFTALPWVLVGCFFTYRFPFVGFHWVRIDKMKMTSIRISVFPPNAHVPVVYALWRVPKPAIRPASASPHRRCGGEYRVIGEVNKAGRQK